MEVGYTPSEWGRRFHALVDPKTGEVINEALGAGAAGPGKTECLIADALPHIWVEHQRCTKGTELHHEHPLEWGASSGWALHLRRTLVQLRQTKQRAARLFKFVDPEADYDKQESTWTFSSGYKYQFGHCQHTSTYEDYMSQQYDWIGFDELTQFEKDQYDYISSRARSGDPVLRPMVKVRSMSNPLAPRDGMENISVSDPHWVRERFVRPAPQGNVILYRDHKLSDGSTQKRTRIYVPAKLSDNPNKEFVRDYEASLMDRPPHIRKIMLEGDWFYTLGAFYGEDIWDPSLHICRPFRVPDDWPRFRSMDWGFKSPGCVLWWAMDPDHNLFCEREFTFQFKMDKEVAREIRRIELDMNSRLWRDGRSILTGAADKQIWEERGDSGRSKAEVMGDLGVDWVRADQRSRASNAQRLAKRLLDHHNRSTTPGLVFMESCVKTIQTLPSIQVDPHNPEEPLKGGPDHHHDAACYACAYASHGAIGVTSSRESRTVDETEHEDRGQYGYGSVI
jgi:hypothetical protein